VKQLIVDLSLDLDKDALKRSSEKTCGVLPGLRADAALAMKGFAMSELRAYRLGELDRSGYRYDPRAAPNAELGEDPSPCGVNAMP